MSTLFHSCISFLRKHRIQISGLCIVILVLAVMVTKAKKDGAIETTTPARKLLTQVVKVTGPVTPSSEAKLSFEKNGTASSVFVGVGDVVTSGQILASLDNDESYANILQARATLSNQEATLEQLKKGPRTEEIAVKAQMVDSAQTALDVLYSVVPDTIRNTDAKVSDAVKTKLAPLFSSLGGEYVLSFNSCDQGVQGLIEKKRNSFEDDLALFQKKSAGISMISDKAAFVAGLDDSYAITQEASTLIDAISTLLSLSCSTNNAALDTNRTTVSSVRSSISSLFDDVSTKRQNITSLKNALAQAQKDLDLTQAGTNPSTIKAQQALVAQAQAQVTQAQVSASKNTLLSPFDGIVTSVSLTKGETVSPGKSVITVISKNAFQIEAKVPEIDIAKIAVGNITKITLDAYGDSVVFDAVVTRIDPSATLSGNVPMYTVIVSFKETDNRIKSGMTANVSLITQIKENALSLPFRFVRMESDGAGFVKIVQGKESISRKVTLGIRSEDGYVEIIDGITERDVVEAINPTLRAAQKENE